MLLLILGIALWSAAHLFKRVQPERRAALGSTGRGLAAAAILASVLLMISGYRMAVPIHIWSPPIFFWHINNLLMLIAVVLLAMSHSKGVVRHWVRHPMLIAFKTWALAHLLVNGDLASILLFGGLLAWAVVTMILINKADPWDRPEKGPLKPDLVAGALGVVLYVIIGVIHGWLGPMPFPMSA